MKPVIIWKERWLRISAGIGWITFTYGTTALGRARGDTAIARVGRAFSHKPCSHHLSWRHTACDGLDIFFDLGLQLSAGGKNYPLSDEIRADIAWWCRNQRSGDPVLTPRGDDYILNLGQKRQLRLGCCREELCLFADNAAIKVQRGSGDDGHGQLKPAQVRFLAAGLNYTLVTRDGRAANISRARLARAAIDAARLGCA